MKRIVVVIGCLLAVITVGQAQTDCERMLEAADTYYNEGDYANAAKMYKIIQEECPDKNSPDSNYGGAAAKLRKCNYKLKEDEYFEKCITIAACNDYLENYPNGRYVARVQQKRAEIIKANANAAEDDLAYQNCFTKEDCLEYMKKYPYGRHVAQVKAMLAQFEEDEAYENCFTESDCETYLKTYPDGKYYSKVLEKKNAFEAERLRKEREAAKTAYMNIKEIDFANTLAGGTIIDDYGATFYVSEIQYLASRITYDGLLDDTRLISLFCKIFRPDGTLMYRPESPSGYTFSTIFRVQTGHNNLYEFPVWGSDSDSYDVAGTYRFELWFEGSRIYRTSFVVEDKNTTLSRGNWRTALKKCCDYVTYSSGNGSFYKGQTYYGIRLGLGLYCSQGIFYDIGNWERGQKNGMGLSITFPGGMVSNCPDCEYYVGEFSSDVKSGKGTCYDKYGNLIYWGTFVNDKPTEIYPTTGYDSYKFESLEYYSGDYYVGETYQGKPHGKGIYIWNSGDMWYGDWKNGSRDGYGIYMQYQGSVSTGTWKGDIQQ